MIVELTVEEWRPWALLIAVLVGGLVCAALIRLVLRLTVLRRAAALPELLAKHVSRPVTFLVPVIAASAVHPVLQLPEISEEIVAKLFFVLEAYVVYRNPADVRDNLQARKIHTQVRLIRQIGVVVVVVLGVAMVLLSFDPVRLDGVLVMEGEWGRVEGITITYVVL